jgi:predicted membrane protein
MKPSKKTNYNNNLTVGLLILIVGVVLLLQRMGVFFPGWLFSWPMLIMAIGVIILVKHQFQNEFGFFMVIFGGVFFIKRELNYPIDISYLIPIGLILLGLYLMVIKRDQNRGFYRGWEQSKKAKNRDPFYTGNPEATFKSTVTADKESPETSRGTQFMDNGDVLHSQALFCGIQKRVFSKNFYGGKISTYFGGTDIDLSQADISETAYLDVDVAFGGVKLIVPPHWDLKIDVTNMFAGVEDKRMYPQTSADPTKVMVIRGTIVFGGLEIKSF